MVIEEVLPKIIYAFHSENREAIAEITTLMQRLLVMVPENTELKRLYALSLIHRVSDEHSEEIPAILDWDEYEWQDEYEKYEELFGRILENRSVDSYKENLAYLAQNPAHGRALLELICGITEAENLSAWDTYQKAVAPYADYREEEPSIALCYFTHGHPEAIEEVLEKNAKCFKQYNVDVFFIDDFHDTQTKEVIGKYAKEYPGIRLISGETADKFYMSVDNRFSEKKYDYIWPCKDRSYITEKAFRDLRYQMAKKRDAVLFGSVTMRSITHSRLYREPLELYEDYSLAATSLNTTVFRTNSLLRYYNNGVLKKKSEEDAWIVPFPHYWMLFDGVTKLPDIRIKVLRRPGVQIFESDKAHTGWMADALNVWADSWIKINEALPDCYNALKYKVIKEEATPGLFGTREVLINLKKQGGLTREKFDEVCENWYRVSDVPIEEVEKIIADE